MSSAPELLTERLRLRATRVSDFAACAALWSDPRVVRYIGGRPSTRTESWARMLRFPGLWELLGYGYWTVEIRASGTFVGQVGLADFKREVLPSIDGLPEAGWVIAPAFHGCGVATEAMRAVLAWSDRELPHSRTCCLIDPANTPSLHVAGKLGYDGAVRGMLGGNTTLVLYRQRPAPAPAQAAAARDAG